jgi:hypothetical protein
VKYLKLDIYDLWASILIICATGLRLIFAALGWPPTNADEGTMGIMALHIAYRGEHPLLFYGQNYMGSLEAYLGAGSFHVFGPSLFALRLGVILLVTCFLVSTYLLARLLYSKQIGLLVLALLCFGSIYVFTREMIATGGTTQTLLFGSLSLLLASWLSFTYSRYARLRTRLLRLPGYACWGLIIGLGVWSDMIVLPTFAVASLLLVLFCWRELLWGWLLILPGFLTGAWPLIEYNRETTPGTDSITTLLGLFQGSTTQAPHTLLGILHGIEGTIQVSIPTATGNPFCPVMEIPQLGDNSPHTMSCTLIHAVWGFGYLGLLLLALLTTIGGLWLLYRQHRTDPRAATRAAPTIHGGHAARLGGAALVAARRVPPHATGPKTPTRVSTVVRYIARLCMIGSAILTISIYAVSSGPMSWPGFHSRYLVSLLIVTPAVLAPLWTGATALKVREVPIAAILTVLSRVTLALIFLLFLVGTGILISEIPAAQAQNQREADLIHNLEHIGATHIYTDYWSCDNTAFLSDDHIICAVVDVNLQLTHNRDPQYATIVAHDPHATYVLPVASDQLAAMEHKAVHASSRYRVFHFDGYVVYQPQ